MNRERALAWLAWRADQLRHRGRCTVTFERPASGGWRARIVIGGTTITSGYWPRRPR